MDDGLLTEAFEAAKSPDAESKNHRSDDEYGCIHDHLLFISASGARNRKLLCAYTDVNSARRISRGGVLAWSDLGET